MSTGYLPSPAGALVIEVCGGIAYGKTTLARLLAELGIRPTLEDFRANPFYLDFYQDPRSFAFETEVTFTLQHYHQIKVAKRVGHVLCADFSLYLDLAYSKVTLQGEQLATYARLNRLLRDEIRHPAVLVHLKCEPEVALERIRRRGRPSELGIELSYLEALDQALQGIADAAPSPTVVLRVDSEALDFASNERDKGAVLELARSAIWGR